MAGRFVSIFVAKVLNHLCTKHCLIFRYQWNNQNCYQINEQQFYQIYLNKVTRPRNIILSSLILCVVSALLLVLVGGKNKYGLYVGTGITTFINIIATLDYEYKQYINIYNVLAIGLLGFFVSWQYGACYSWIAQKGDISGRPASIFFIG